MTRPLALVLLVGLLSLTTTILAAPSEEQKAVKEKLRELGDFIGGWKGSTATKDRPGPRDKTWDETVNWGWKFKGDDAWLVVEFKGGPFLKGGELRWLPNKKAFEFTGTALDGKEKLAFAGEFKDDKLLLTRTDPKSKEIQTVRMYLAGEGIRLIYRVERRRTPKALPRLEYQFAATKIGESLAKKEKGPECVVSGGRGTMPVTYMGETFFVCCSGCAEAFKENPKKYVDEFKKNKKK
jgi:hypothetical protein